MRRIHSIRKRIEEHPVLAFFLGAYAITWGIWFPVLTAIDRGWMAYNTTTILVLVAGSFGPRPSRLPSSRTSPAGV